MMPQRLGAFVDMDVVSPEGVDVSSEIRSSSCDQNRSLTSKDNNGKLELREERVESNFCISEQRTPIDIKFENISYTATYKTRQGNLPSFLKRKEQKEILQKVNGRFRAGQFVAIMGPSGAGKSTLLDVLSGYKIHGIGGTVFVNGVTRNMRDFRRISCYITQDDRLQPLLTIAENMQIAADLKLPTHESPRRKNFLIDQILQKLGLLKNKQTKASQLSGGQKKRLSIALELISNPTVMFLDEPTTGLDSSSCLSCIQLLKKLAADGVSIICTIHQPSASLLTFFDQLYVLASGKCLYQGSPEKLVSYLELVESPCPKFHNPADYVIELACGEYGQDIVDKMIDTCENGKSLTFMKSPDTTFASLNAVKQNGDKKFTNENGHLLATSQFNQLKVLLRREIIKSKRNRTLTYLRLGVNFLVSMMLGTLYWRAGVDGSKVLDNYNLLFSILIHHMMSTMMLTILTFPTEMSILVKEHFNRWYSLKMYFTSITLVDIPLSVCCSLIFTSVIYLMTAQPYEMNRFFMFFLSSTLVVFVAQGFGLMIGAYFNVINGTFMGPTLSIPMMMFAGFGVRLSDLHFCFYWMSYLSYLRFGLEGLVGAIYGSERGTLDCPVEVNYCHFKYPKKLLAEVGVMADQFDNDVIILTLFIFLLRIGAFLMLKHKLISLR